MGKIKTDLIIILAYCLIYGMIVFSVLFMLYVGYTGLISGNIFYAIGGGILLALGLYIPFNFIIRSERVRNLVTTTLVFALGGWLLFIGWLVAIGLMIVPFRDVDLTVDLGILILKPGFIKFLLIVADLFIIYYLCKGIQSFFKIKFGKKKS